MNQSLKKYIQSLSSDKKQKVFSLRRELKDVSANFIKLKKDKNFYRILDFNNVLICIIPKYVNSMNKTYFIANMLFDIFDSYFCDDKSYTKKKVHFNKGLNFEDLLFIIVNKFSYL